MNLRNNFHRLASALINEGKKDSARMVLDKCIEVIPDNCIPFDYFVIPLAEDYYTIGENEKANALVERLIVVFDEHLKYYFQFTGERARIYNSDIQQDLYMVQKLSQITQKYKQNDLYKQVYDVLEKNVNLNQAGNK